jgi:hypothetical protein
MNRARSVDELIARIAASAEKSQRRRRVWGVALLLGALGVGCATLAVVVMEVNVKIRTAEALNQTIAKLQKEEEEWRTKMEQQRSAYETLKKSAEQLYAVRVTPSNQVYELRATAAPTGRQTSSGPEYTFTASVNSSKETLATIRRVTYHFDHPTFMLKEFVSEDREKRFAISYTGWGCLNKVNVRVDLRDGTQQELDFDMCKSLGWPLLR